MRVNACQVRLQKWWCPLLSGVQCACKNGSDCLCVSENENSLLVCGKGEERKKRKKQLKIHFWCASEISMNAPPEGAGGSTTITKPSALDTASSSHHQVASALATASSSHHHFCKHTGHHRAVVITSRRCKLVVSTAQWCPVRLQNWWCPLLAVASALANW